MPHGIMCLLNLATTCAKAHEPIQMLWGLGRAQETCDRRRSGFPQQKGRYFLGGRAPLRCGFRQNSSTNCSEYLVFIAESGNYRGGREHCCAYVGKHHWRLVCNNCQTGISAIEWKGWNLPWPRVVLCLLAIIPVLTTIKIDRNWVLRSRPKRNQRNENEIFL